MVVGNDECGENEAEMTRGRKQEEELTRENTGVIVFAVFVTWARHEGETVPRGSLKEEFDAAKARLPEGTGLYMGCTEKLGAENLGLRAHNAIVKLRGKLATVGDVAQWFDL